ncbi:hypothetical protein VTN49DRAFT_7477 [Thermomyces lanuginosus]|uniref:uncharacterized protein n=1 Tax=Thermomyces lanuginosus TaxID=5541 RepID=UPI003742AFE1
MDNEWVFTLKAGTNSGSALIANRVHRFWLCFKRDPSLEASTNIRLPCLGFRSRRQANIAKPPPLARSEPILITEHSRWPTE